MASQATNEIVPYTSEEESTSGEESSEEESSSVESQEELVQVIEPVIKVNWTQHGGGTDGYYYFTNQAGKGPMNAIHEDFVDVKDLLEDINVELGKNGGRRINCLKIFRWTSPGAVLVTNEDIDDRFRTIFQHPLWQNVYSNKKLNTRQSMGKKTAANPKVVGSYAGIIRGPGELLKDLHLAKYCVGDENIRGYEPNIFTNELISSEYKSKYTQMVAEDFGLWLLRDTGEYGSTRGVDDVKFEKKFPEDWMKGIQEKERKNALQKMHNDIFKIGKGQAGDTMSSKMSEIIKQIIVGCSKAVKNKKEWEDNCQNWEFYPISCSPMSGVEGKKALLRTDYGGASDALKKAHAQLGESYNALYSYEAEDQEVDGMREALLAKVEHDHIEIEKKIEAAEKKKTVVYRRENVNGALWFIYLLNIARRCWVFKEGKDIRQKYVKDKIEELTEEKKTVVDLFDPGTIEFTNAFDVLDPDERKQLYTDINGILQNVRPNVARRTAKGQNQEKVSTFEDVVIIGETNEKYNLFIDASLMEFMGRLSQGVKLDARAHLFSKIESDWIEGEPSLLDKIINFVDEKFVELRMRRWGTTSLKLPRLNKQEETSEGEETSEEIKIPIIIKIIFYVIYSCSHAEDGIAKKYWTDPMSKEKQQKMWAKLDKQHKSKSNKGVDETMGGKWGKFLAPTMDYAFTFFRSLLGRVVEFRESGNGGRIANGVLKDLDSVMGGKEVELQEHEELYYEYLRTAFDFVGPIRAELKYIMHRTDFQETVLAQYNKSNAEEEGVQLSDFFLDKVKEELQVMLNKTENEYEDKIKYDDDAVKGIIDRMKSWGQILIPMPNNGEYTWPKAEVRGKRTEIVIMNGPYKHKVGEAITEKGVRSVKQGGKKKRKKRTRRKRKKKRKRTRKRKKRNCKKRMKKKIICLSAPNKKATRKLIRVTKKLARMKGIRLSKCSKQRIKKWGKKKKRTRRKR